MLYKCPFNGVTDGVNKEFALPENVLHEELEIVIVNGIPLKKVAESPDGLEFSVASGKFLFGFAPITGDVLLIDIP